jgi:hypothetical protein
MKIFLPILGLMLTLVVVGCAGVRPAEDSSASDTKLDRKVYDAKDGEVNASESCYFSR